MTTYPGEGKMEESKALERIHCEVCGHNALSHKGKSPYICRIDTCKCKYFKFPKEGPKDSIPVDFLESANPNVTPLKKLNISEKSIEELYQKIFGEGMNKMNEARETFEAALPNGEVRTQSSTGAEKGVKPQRYDLIPVPALDLLAELYGNGAQKYAAHNWRQGYEWSKSYAAAMRHMTRFWEGEDIDPEMQVPHVICAAFHMFALATYLVEHPEFDDRFSTTEKKESFTDHLTSNSGLDYDTVAERLWSGLNNEYSSIDWARAQVLAQDTDNFSDLRNVYLNVLAIAKSIVSQ